MAVASGLGVLTLTRDGMPMIRRRTKRQGIGGDARGECRRAPKTFNGEPTMGSGDLRYWSFCSNQGFANTRVNDCVHDERVPVGPDRPARGRLTEPVARSRAQPAAWLPWFRRFLFE